MRVLKGCVWVAFTVALLAVAAYLTGRFELSDRLAGVFLSAQVWLPPTLSFDQFLAVLAVASLLLIGLMVVGSAAILVRAATRSQQRLDEVLTAKRETQHVRDQHQQEYGQLRTIAHGLAKQLDKRMLVRALVETASHIASTGQASGIVSLWRFHFETETIRFEEGCYCDESFFQQTTVQPTELPFSRVISVRKPWVFLLEQEDLPLLQPEKIPQLGSATGVLMVPLVVEQAVLGILLIFCQPEVVSSYEIRRPFFEAVWGELTLALAVAVQGEVAILDRLTGVHNRDYFMKRFVQEIERANRYQLPLSVLMVDLDNFKLVNDMLGHPQGDAVLKLIARLIKRAVRAIDLVARYGGEEFILMLPETSFGEDSGAPLVAERVRQAVEEEFLGMQRPLNLTISIGVVCRRFPEDREMGQQELIRLADEQLYRAKAGGKNKVCVRLPEATQETPHQVS
jgi:diguanylate cyclase (GGDEF)-like protein